MEEFAKKIDELIIILKEHTQKMDRIIGYIETCFLALNDHEKRISALEKTVFNKNVTKM